MSMGEVILTDSPIVIVGGRALKFEVIGLGVHLKFQRNRRKRKVRNREDEVEGPKKWLDHLAGQCLHQSSQVPSK